MKPLERSYHKTGTCENERPSSHGSRVWPKVKFLSTDDDNDAEDGSSHLTGEVNRYKVAHFQKMTHILAVFRLEQNNVKYRWLWNTNAPLPQHIENRVDLWHWPFTYWPENQYGLSAHQGLSTYQVWSFCGKAFLSYQLHKVRDTNMTYDLDLWPTDLKINRDHLLIMD